MIAPTVFKQQLLAAAAVLATCAIGFGVSVMTRNNTEEQLPDRLGATTYSRSALGHRSLVMFLTKLGIPISVSFESPPRSDAHDLIVVAEPRVDRTTMASLRTEMPGHTVLLVLPKFQGIPDAEHPGWIESEAELPLPQVVPVLRSVDATAQIVRPKALAGLRSAGQKVNAWSSAPQLIKSTALIPIIANEDGMLAGEFKSSGRRVIVLSDPDLIANRGLARGDNAMLVAMLVGLGRGAGGKVVLDETVHGSIKSFSHPALLIFTFPLVLLTLQVAIGAALLVWSCWARRSPVQAIPTAFSLGREALIQFGARLLVQPAHLSTLAARYSEETVWDVSRRINSSVSLVGLPPFEWLARIGVARGVKERIPIPGAVPTTNDTDGCLQQARAAFRWKKEMLNERQ